MALRARNVSGAFEKRAPGHCTNSCASVATQDRLGCKPHFAVDKITAETDVAGTAAGVLGPAGMLLCALVGMVFAMSVLASHMKLQQHF